MSVNQIREGQLESLQFILFSGEKDEGEQKGWAIKQEEAVILECLKLKKIN